jgi:hypothetical protein
MKSGSGEVVHSDPVYRLSAGEEARLTGSHYKEYQSHNRGSEYTEADHARLSPPAFPMRLIELFGDLKPE